MPPNLGAAKQQILRPTRNEVHPHGHHPKLHSRTKRRLSGFFVKSREESQCPYCEGKFKVIGSRGRSLYKQDGSCLFLMIRRLRCRDCKKISHELPDMVVPYKHHESDTIANALRENMPQETDCCPAETSTINRWKHWFFYNQTFLEESLRTLQKQNSSLLLTLPLSPLSRQREGWLRLLVCYLVNSGFWMHTRFA